MSKDNPEPYSAVKAKLVQQILRKQEIEANLNKIEDTIYDKESTYFAESNFGNIVKGFDNFTKANTGGSHKKKIVYTDDDHIFSLSSANFVKNYSRRQGLSVKGDEYDEYEDSVEPLDGSSPQVGTPRKRKIRTMMGGTQ